jgi:uncharacterized membrane protein HdeD (DUF308 family)
MMDRGSGSEYLRDYLDFDLEIREGGSQGYSVVVHSPAGEAEEEMRFPFNEGQLRDKLKDLEIALLRSSGTRRGLSSEERTVQDFGQSLFEAVLVGKVGTCYYRSMDQAQQQGKGLRLKLHVQPPNLTVLPWEFLYDPDRDEYLCFSRDTPIVRYTDLRQPISRLTVAPPLRILGMVASPRDLDPLDVEHEKGLMDEAVEDLQAEGLVELTWLEGQTWRDLQRAMRRGGPWHIFHFVGHGDFDLTAEEGLVAFADERTGRRHLLRSRDLARLLDGHRYLRLAFLNSCEGARGSEGDPFSGTAATLVRRGIPAVVAMQYQITDKAAIEFSSAFYESLVDGLPVDAAVTEARVAVSMDSMLEWGTPVLYMRSPDGRLFDISTAAPRPHPTPETEDRQAEDPLRRYRESVESAWVDGKLESNEVQQLRHLANNKLRLSPNAASDIEREVMGDTIETILERQEEATRQEQRNRRLEELYTQARRLHRDRNWQAVIDLFEQINSEDPNYSDPEGLLASSSAALEQRVATLYDRGQRHMRVQEWQQALECFEEIQRLEPNYRETETLLAQARQQESADDAEKVEASERQRQQTAGRFTNQAERVQPERSADTEPQPPLPLLARNWWALALGGLIMVILGLFVSLTLAVSDQEEVFVRLLSGSLVIASGVFIIIASSAAHPRLLLRTQGVISSVAGVVVLLSGAWGDSPFSLYYYSFDFWALCLGLVQIIAAIRLGWEFKVMPLMVVSGALLVVYGLYSTYITTVCILGGYSGSGACESPTPWLLGVLLLASGASLVAFAFGVRRWEGREVGA